MLVGVENTDSAIEIVKNGSWLTHIIAKNPTRHQAIREAVDGWAGLISVGQLRAVNGEQTLPFHTDSVNAIAVDRSNIPASKVPDAELHRVLAPGGVLLISRNKTWDVKIEPENPGYDGWLTYGANMQQTGRNNDTEVKPSNSVKWWSKVSPSSDLRANDGIAIMTSGRRVKGEMSGRDVYSGVPIWRGTTGHTGFDSTPSGLIVTEHGAIHFKPGKLQPAILTDLKTGKTLVTYEKGVKVPLKPVGRHPPVQMPKEEQAKIMGRRIGSHRRSDLVVLLAHENFLYQFFGPDIVKLDILSGEKLWSHKLQHPISHAVLSHDGNTLYVNEAYSVNANRARWGGYPSEAVSAFDLSKKEGRLLWRFDLDDQKKGPAKKIKEWGARDKHETSELMALPNGNVVVYNKYTNLTDDTKHGVLVLEGKTGEIVYESPVETKKQTHMTNNAIWWQDQLWAWGPMSPMKSYSLEKGSTANFYRGLGGNQRCTRVTGTENYMIFGFTSYFGKEGDWTQTGIARGHCSEPAYPTYGSVIFISDTVCSCYNGPRGTFALVPAEKQEVYPEEERLGNAPIYPTTPSVDIPETALTHEWQPSKYLAYFLYDQTPAVQAGKYSLSADVHRHLLTAKQGDRVAWTWRAGARIWTAPATSNTHAYVGSSDGRVTCLDLATGKPSWSFLAAPMEGYAVVSGQLESRWPVYHVLLHEEKLYVTAGHHNEVDGGIWCYQLDPNTGKVLRQTNLYTEPSVVQTAANETKRQDAHRWRGNRDVISRGIMNNGFMLNQQGKPVIMNRWLYKRGSSGSKWGYHWPLSVKTKNTADKNKQDPDRPTTRHFNVKFEEWNGQTINPYTTDQILSRTKKKK